MPDRRETEAESFSRGIAIIGGWMLIIFGGLLLMASCTVIDFSRVDHAGNHVLTGPPPWLYLLSVAFIGVGWLVVKSAGRRDY